MTAIWEEIKREIRTEIPEKTFSLWIEPITFLDRKEDTFILGCPNKFTRNWILEHYIEVLEKRFNIFGNGNYKVALEIGTSEKRIPSPEVPQEEIREEPRQLHLPNIPINTVKGRRRFNSEFTFDRFVVGDCNEFAYRTSKELALGGKWSHQSLFLVSDTGLGKSHLSQAIGHAILDRDPRQAVCYITAEDFLNEMIASLKNGRIDEFKNKYRRACDVLLLEDVHFLAGKSKSQLELGYTLDALANDRKRIIFTSALLPKDIPNMGKDLSSRLGSGIIAGIDIPDYGTRQKILQQKSTDLDLAMSEEVVHFLAEHLTLNVRQLESALNCIKVRSELMKARIDLDLAREVVSSYSSEERCVTLKNILELVCQYYKVDPPELQSKSRKKIHSYPRNIYIYLCRNHTDSTMEAIGRSVNRKHSTIVYASEVIEKKMKLDGRLRKEVGFLTEKLENMRT